MYNEQRSIRIDSYDFFGYLAPGLLVFVSIIFSVLLVGSGVRIKCVLAEINEYFEAIGNQQLIIVLIVAIVVSYVLGHLAASLAALLFEKTIVGKIFQYPFMSIIFSEKSNKDATSNYYRAIVFLFFSMVLTMIMGSSPLSETSRSSIINILAILAIIALMLTVIKVTLAFIRLCAKFPVGEPKCIKFLYLIVSTPFYLVEIFSSKFCGQLKTLPETTHNLIFDRYKRIFGDELTQDQKTEVYWSIYWYITNQNAYIRAKVDKFLILYSFMRNLSFAALLSSVILVTPSWMLHKGNEYLCVFSVALFCLSIIFSFRYYYLYYGYFSKTIFRAFAYLEDHQELRNCSAQNADQRHATEEHG